MADFSHWVFIDEAGHGYRPQKAKAEGVNTGYVTAAVAVDTSRIDDLAHGLEWVSYNHLRDGVTELKAADLPGTLSPGSTELAFAKDVRSLLQEVGADAWAVATRADVRPPRNFPSEVESAPEIARQFLIERIDGFVESFPQGEINALLIWDLSETQALRTFSRSVALFTNSFSGKPRSSSLCPTILGGLSEEWPGLQLADTIANFGLHAFGVSEGFRYASAQKSLAFHTQILPCLKRSKKNTLVGWKVWKG